jgi:hypothetical protein
MLIEPVAAQGEHGGVSDPRGFETAGVPYAGQADCPDAQVTVPPGPLTFALPETPKVPALTVSALPLVL